MEIEVTRRGEEIKFDTQYATPTEWLNFEADKELIEYAYEEFCKKFKDTTWATPSDTFEFIQEKGLWDEFLEKWRIDADVEPWIDKFLEDKWQDWERDNWLRNN